MKTKLIYALSGAVLLAGSWSGRANLIPTLSSRTPDGVADYRFSYDTQLSADQRVNNGDYFTIYDFAGFDGGVTMPSDWLFSTANMGVTPGLVAPSDDPTIPNLTFTYNGTEQIGPFDFGPFSALSTFSEFASDNFTAQATRSSGPDEGTKISNIGTISVPITPKTTVPDTGSTLALLGLGVLGLSAASGRRTLHAR